MSEKPPSVGPDGVLQDGPFDLRGVERVLIGLDILAGGRFGTLELRSRGRDDDCWTVSRSALTGRYRTEIAWGAPFDGEVGLVRFVPEPGSLPFDAVHVAWTRRLTRKATPDEASSENEDQGA